MTISINIGPALKYDANFQGDIFKMTHCGRNSFDR